MTGQRPCEPSGFGLFYQREKLIHKFITYEERIKKKEDNNCIYPDAGCHSPQCPKLQF